MPRLVFSLRVIVLVNPVCFLAGLGASERCREGRHGDQGRATLVLPILLVSGCCVLCRELSILIPSLFSGCSPYSLFPFSPFLSRKRMHFYGAYGLGLRLWHGLIAAPRACPAGPKQRARYNWVTLIYVARHTHSRDIYSIR